MKKILTLGMAMTMAALTGCGGSETQAGSQTGQQYSNNHLSSVFILPYKFPKSSYRRSFAKADFFCMDLT